jgi:hypothetical protein
MTTLFVVEMNGGKYVRWAAAIEAEGTIGDGCWNCPPTVPGL